MPSHHGQKVDLGKNAPVTREGPGAVTSDSLAAESQAFKSANEVSSTVPRENLSTTTHETGSTQQYSHPDTGASAQRATSGAGTAPTYVNSVVNPHGSDTSGPHGKNLKEDEGLSQDKSKNASFTEFGTKKDPGALAEKNFALKDSAVAGGAGATGARQTGVDGKQPFGALSSEERA
jgi:hypothetical protein